MSIVEKPGYSAVVDLQLRIDGEEFSLAQTGPDFCVLSQFVQLPGGSLPAKIAEVIVMIDGNVRTRKVQLTSVLPDEHRRIFFTVLNQ